jgi:threonine 3-dehydrogenase
VLWDSVVFGSAGLLALGGVTVEKMRALVKSRREVGLWMEEVPVPEVGRDDVLIEVDRTGVCGTDLHIYNWDAWAQQTIPVPMVIGHEFVGEIVEVGRNVEDFSAGMVVSGEGHIVCGHCRNCMAGRRHLCAHTSGIGVDRPGAFAEYIAIPKANVWEHAPGIDRDFAAIFDPFGNAVHTALQFNPLGEDVLITGAGPIGLMAAAVCKHAGARYIVVTDLNPFRLELASRMGATRVVDVSREKLTDVQAELGMKEGFDIGLEMSGNAQAFRDLIANMCHGGKIAVLGIPTEEISIDWNDVIFSMLTIKGVYGRQMYETWYQMTVMLQAGLDLDPVITHRLAAEDYEQAFAAMKGGEAAKVVLQW